MRPPDFLVIGAMKSGTTTLHHDLCSNPAFCMSEKEASGLADEQVLSSHGRRRYSQCYAHADPQQCCGDVSTTYSMLPDIPKIPQRAKQIAPRLKIIYIVREPVSRCISHHRHMCNWSGEGRMSPDINTELLRTPSLISFSRYAFQLRPWIETFGRENVHIIRFEDYVRDRRQTNDALCRFLGVQPRPNLVDPDVVLNQAEERHVASGIWRPIVRSSVYRSLVRPLMSQSVRRHARHKFLDKAETRPTWPTRHSIEHIIDAVRDDVFRLQALMSLNEPPWNFDDVRRKYAVDCLDVLPTTNGQGAGFTSHAQAE